MSARRRAIALTVAILILTLAFAMGSIPTGVRVMAGPAAPPLLKVVKWDYPKFNNASITVVGDAGHNLKPYEFWKDQFNRQLSLDSRDELV